MNQPVVESDVGRPDQKPTFVLEESCIESVPSQKSILGLIWACINS